VFSDGGDARVDGAGDLDLGVDGGAQARVSPSAFGGVLARMVDQDHRAGELGPDRIAGPDQGAHILAAVLVSADHRPRDGVDDQVQFGLRVAGAQFPQHGEQRRDAHGVQGVPSSNIGAPTSLKPPPPRPFVVTSPRKGKGRHPFERRP
jgi:hypothetical protein